MGTQQVWVHNACGDDALSTLTEKLGRKPTKKELQNFELKEGISTQRNKVAKKKAQQQKSENVGGGSEHTRGASKSKEGKHAKGKARKQRDQARARENNDS